MKRFAQKLLCILLAWTFAVPCYGIERNVSGQYLEVMAIDRSTGGPKTGDAGNITCYVSKDHGTLNALGDTSATEVSSTNAPGVYRFDLTQAETDAKQLLFTGKSSTSNVDIVRWITPTVPANFSLASIDSSGRLDIAKIAGTSQTARDIGASVLLSSGTGTGQLDFTSGVVKSNVTQNAGSAITASSGRQEVNVSHFGGVAGTFNNGRPETLSAETRRFYCRATSGSDSNSGRVYASPFLTPDAGIDLMRSGEELFLRNGSYGALDLQSKSNLKFRGETRAGVITGCIPAENGTHISNLTITANTDSQQQPNGVGVYAFNVTGMVVEYVTINSSFDGIINWQGADLTVRHVLINGSPGYDCVNVSGCLGFDISNLTAVCDGAFTPASPNTSPYRAVNAGGKARGKIKDSLLEIAFAGTHARAMACLDLGGNATVEGEKSHVYCENVTFRANRTNESDTGDLACIRPFQSDSEAPGPYSLVLDSCKLECSNEGSGAEYLIDASPAGTTVWLINTPVDLSRCLGAENIHAVSSIEEVEDIATTLADATNGLAAIKTVAAAAQTAAETAGDAAGNARTEATAAKVAAQNADTKLDDKPTAAEIWASLTSGLTTAGSIGKRIADNLDAKVSEVEGGGGGGFDATERAQILAALSIGEDTGVPTAQTFKVKRVDGQLRCTAIVPKDVGETFDVLVDFRDVLASGDAIKAEVDGGIEAIALIDDGNEGEQIECDAFDDATEADVWMNAAIRLHDVSGGTVGQKDRFRVQARTVDGKLLSVPCTIQVTDAGAQ